MKKISMILGSALMMLTVGCTTDTTKEVVNNDNKVIIGLSVDATRTSLGDKNGTEYPVLWSAGDKVAVNGVVSEPLAAEYAGKTAAQFAVTGVAAPFDVIYPAGVLLEDGTVGISEIQEYVPGSFAQGSAVMVGHSDTPNGVIKNLYGFVKIPILKGDEKTIKSVTLHSNNLEAMSGVFAVDYVNAALEPLSGMDFVKVTAADGIPFVNDKAEVVIAVPAGTYAKGFSVKIVSTDGKALTKKAYEANGVTIAASTLLAMPDVEFFPNENVSEITDAAQLQAFLDAASAGDYTNFKNENGEVILGSDIDMTGVTLTSATQFDGVFNGQGYALKNWKSDGVALFAANSGTIKNILIDDTCELTLPAITANTNFGFIVSNNTGIVSGCANNADVNFELTENLTVQYKFGTLVGYSVQPGVIMNCVNNGNINLKFSAITDASDYFGGIVGNTSASDASFVVMSNNINNGNIKVVVSGASKNVYAGGVAGACNSKGTVNNCINNGIVYYEHTAGGTGAYPNIGGITGYTPCTMNDCKNTGDVTFKTEASVTRPAVAGIAGYLNGNANRCVNYGNILAQGNKFGKASKATSGGVGGAQWPIVAGVAGCCGSVASGTAKHMNDCYNYGNVTMVNPNGSCVCGCAGVVAYACGDVINCHNEGNVTASAGTQVYVSGVVGFQYIGNDKIENCTNKGNITLQPGEESTDSYSYAAGIIGSYNKYENSTVTNCVNEGKITSNWHKVVWVGGIAGCCRGTSSNCVNKGDVELNNAGTSVESKKSCVAGFCGFAGGSSVNCENYGKVINNSTNQFVSASGYLGVAGNTEQSHIGGIVKCEIVSPNAPAAILLGGQQNNAATLTAGTEEAPIIVMNGTTLNGEAVTAETLNDATKLATSLEAANVGNIKYEIGSTIKFE